MIQEGKVEIVEEEKPKALQQAQPKEVQTQNQPESNQNVKKSVLFYILIFIVSVLLILIIIFGAFAIYNMNNSDKIAKMYQVKTKVKQFLLFHQSLIQYRSQI